MEPTRKYQKGDHKAEEYYWRLQREYIIYVDNHLFNGSWDMAINQIKLLTKEGKVKEELIDCPFCEETGFDKIGLKLHLEKWCDEFKNTVLPKGIIDLSRYV